MQKYRRYLLKAFVGVGGLFLVSKFFKTRALSGEESQDFSSESPLKKERTIGKTARRKFESLQWKRLSLNNPDAIKTEYKVVVIGSGYGASVAAARLSEKVGGELCLLERGREFVPGEYPSGPTAALKNVRLDGVLRPMGKDNSNQLGLFNLTSTGGMDVVTGNGLGGGSNINANVILEPLEEVFTGEVANINKNGPAKKWPLQIEDFRPYFKKVRTMLKAERFRAGVWVEDGKGGHWEIDSQLKSQWKKNLAGFGFQEQDFDQLIPEQRRSQLMRQFAGKYRRSLKSKSSDLNSKLDFEMDAPPLAVNLSNYDTGISGRMNHVGVPQRLCNQCGDCVSGCNTGAKNTLIMNYLPLAKNHGAEMFTQVEVDYVEKLEGHKRRYRVHYVFYRKRALNLIPYTRKGFVDTDHVVFGAGSLGSTKILMKSQKYGGFSFSEHLGKSFSGNGDGLSAASKHNLDVTNLGVGSDGNPFLEDNVQLKKSEIAGPCITSKIDMRKDFGIMFQDASVPSVLGGLLKNKMNDLLIFLTMGYDSSSGTMTLNDQDKIKIDFPDLASEKGHTNSKQIVTGVAEDLNGKFLENPRVKYKIPFLNEGEGVPVTVHALGGCSMGDDRRNGVINSAGQVFSGVGNDPLGIYPGLYVTCGAALPTSVGANPLLTISAFAERVSAYMLGQPDQNDPRRHEVQKYQVL
ncbi:MAG: GMC family oxidoreductase N-terminal domain-containing protein [Bdellovibrio sp.]